MTAVLLTSQFYVQVMQNDCQVELYLEHTPHTTADKVIETVQGVRSDTVDQPYIFKGKERKIKENKRF